MFGKWEDYRDWQLINCLLLISSQSHIITFIFLFSYLLFFRMTHFINIPTAPGHTNMIQMMLVLKVSFLTCLAIS